MFKTVGNGASMDFLADGANNYVGFNSTTSGDDIRFQTNDGSERVRILAAGGITFNADTAAANALDDYEEGAWTPVISDGTNNATGYSHNHGRYVKIGGLVHVNGFIVLTNLGSVSGNIRMTGLPFANGNVHNNYGSMSFSRCAGLNIQDGASLNGYFVQNQSYLDLYQWNNTAGTGVLQHDELTADATLTFTGTYYASV
jgi:hypothetical protein